MRKETKGKTNELHNRGFKALLRKSLEKGYEEILNELKRLKESNNDILVHHCCRIRFVDKRKTEFREEVKKLRSS